MSDFGNRAPGLVSLLAPGSSIWSSLLGNTFGFLSGTSMAAPHVAGAWAVLKHAAPAATVAQVLGVLQGTGVLINDTPSGGAYRRINVNAARLALVSGGGTVPGAPGTPTINVSGNFVQINWTPPLAGGTPTGYTVIARFVAGGPAVAALPTGLALTTTVNAPNGTYFVTIRASNASGHGPESAGVSVSVPVAPVPPGPPQNLSITPFGNSAALNWQPPIAGGLVTGYTVVASFSPGGAPIAVLPVAGTSLTVNSIPPGTYFVRVFAGNPGSISTPSNEVSLTVVGPQAPSAPTLNPAGVVGSTVHLSWTPAGTGGLPTSYVVMASFTSGGAPIASLPTTSTALSVPEVPPGTYFVRVFAVNGVGPSLPSNEIVVPVP